MKRKIRLTESELTRLIKRVISEQNTTKDVTVKVDCTKKTVDGFTGIADGFFTPHCATPKGTTTPTESVTKNMVDFKSSVVNDLLAGFGAKSVEVFGDTNVKPPRVGLVLFSMLKPLSDPNLGELTPTYQCARVTGQGEAGETKNYQKYFKYGSPEYNLFVAAAKKQCQASQLKIQGK